jgi:hypothetical protein
VSLKAQQWTLRVVPGRLASMSSGWGDEIETLRGNDVRLRRAELEEYEQVALPWYQDAEVLQLSEGGEAPYDRLQIRRMFEVLSGKGELYLIEARRPAAGAWSATPRCSPRTWRS